MTESGSFSSADGVNPQASSAELTSVNSQNDVSTGSDPAVNRAQSIVNSDNGMTRSDSDNQGNQAPPPRIFDVALEMRDAGINVVPVKEDGTKAPDLPRWTKYQQQRTTGDQAWSWFGSDQKTGIGCIYGAVSGNVEMLEFEGRAVREGILDEVTELMENSGFASAWEAITTGWVDQSPSGGLHFRFRVDGTPVKHNTKLASRPSTDEELAAWKAEQQASINTETDTDVRFKRQEKLNRITSGDRVPQVFIETRGEGGFGVCAPSHGSVHPSGRPYLRLAGGPASMPVIDAETYEALHDICSASDRMPKQEAPQWRGRPVQVPDGQLRPGDDFNERGDIPELLKQHGWTFMYQRGSAQYWARPGKQRGIGASFNYRDNGKLYVFTSSTEFDNEKAYTPFSAYAVLEHGGNYSEAARSLGKQGYGTQAGSFIPTPRVTDDWTSEFQGVVQSFSRSEGVTHPPAGNGGGGGEKDSPDCTPTYTDQTTDKSDGDGPATYSSPEAPMRVARELESTWVTAKGRTLHHWRDQWMRWTGTHWTETGVSALRSRLYLRLEHAIYYSPNKKGQLEAKAWNPSIKKISSLVDAISAVTHLDERIEPGAWLGLKKDGPRLISCANVMIDPITKETREHTPAYFTTSSVPYDYDPEAECPQWLDFLEKVFPGDIQSQQLLQEWVGYVISGWTHYQKALQLLGPPRAGKGTVARIIEKLIGKENAVGSTLKTLISNFGLAPVIDKSLCVIGDAQMENRNASEVVARLLSITGEDSLTVDRKNRAHWTGKIPARIMVLANKAPRFSDNSGAIVGRFMTLHFTQSFAGREDKTLETRLTTELAGILNWALEGLRRLDERGHFVQPESSESIIESQREESAPHQTFVEERCVTGTDEWITKEQLFAHWNMWCSINNYRYPGTSAAFAAELYAAVPGVKAGYKRLNGKLTRVYTGITGHVDPGIICPPTQSDPRITTPQQE